MFGHFRTLCMKGLTHFWPMFPFIPRENTRKAKVSNGSYKRLNFRSHKLQGKYLEIMKNFKNIVKLLSISMKQIVCTFFFCFPGVYFLGELSFIWSLGLSKKLLFAPIRSRIKYTLFISFIPYVEDFKNFLKKHT